MRQSTHLNQATLVAGVILGTATGDSLGLPREGISRNRARKIFGDPPLRHAFIAGRGMTSDDTEHTCMTAQALLASHGDPRKFAVSLSWRLRGWILALPAGVGFATARATIKLWLGFGTDRSGVWSAGNGPAMRAAIIGVYARNNTSRLIELVKVSTRLTHTDPAAESGALAIALAAAFGADEGVEGITPDAYLSAVRPYLADSPMMELLEIVARDVTAGKSLQDYLQDAGLANGITGYINHTVPAAIFCWLKWPSDFREAVEQAITAGGDTDTTGAIVGALIGATAGDETIPGEWLDSLFEWPRNKKWMKRLAAALTNDIGSEPKTGRPLALFWPGLLARNVFFLLVVLLHGLRRTLPPY